jgi:hypothetical protein
MKRMTKIAGVLALGALISGSVTTEASAHGWGGRGFGGGFGIGFGYGLAAPFFAPGYYYAPTVVYAPPPAYYAPPPPYYYQPYPAQAPQQPVQASAQPSAAAQGSGYAQSCNAGSYVCPMEVAVPAGAHCYCPGNNGNRVYGSAQ